MRIGSKHSEATKAKMSAASLGRKMSAEAIAKRTASRVGFCHTDETRAKIASARWGKPGKPRKHQAVLWDDDSWLREQYVTRSVTEIAEELGNVTPKSVHCALVRFDIPITKNKHQSRANRVSPKAAAQRREKLGLRHSYLQRQLAWFLYHAGFTDIRQEEPFYTFNVDFYSPSQHLAFEADGSFHQIPEHQEHDQRRDKFLMIQYGLPVIRFSTTDIRRLYRTVQWQ